MEGLAVKLRDKRLRFWIVPLFAALAAQVSFRPLYNEFIIAVGVVVLGYALVMEREIPPFLLSMLTGVFTVTLRSFLGEIKGFSNNVQALVFYLIFGMLAQAINLPRFHNNPFKIGVLLAGMDWLANFAESYVLGDLSSAVVRSILLAGCLRSLAVVVLLELYQFQKLYIMESEHQRRYDRLNLLVADIRAETFYLIKSGEEINEVMSKSYHLYEENRDRPEVSGPALEISRAIHEVGKDYRRVLVGLEALTEGMERQKMTLSGVFRIIRENTGRLLEQNGKAVSLRFDTPVDYPVTQFYGLFAILNNLIVNSIDACVENGSIVVSVQEQEENLVFSVRDDGCGIDSELLPYIFSAGFTTKFDKETGEGGNGIGLNHVKNTTTDMGGKIKVDSMPGHGTVFMVTLPKRALIGEGKPNGAKYSDC